MTTVDSRPRRSSTLLWVPIVLAIALLVATVIVSLSWSDRIGEAVSPAISMPTPLSAEEQYLELHGFESKGIRSVEIIDQPTDVTQWTNGDINVYVANATGNLRALQKQGVQCRNPGAFSTEDAFRAMLAAVGKPGIEATPTIVTVDQEHDQVNDDDVPYEVTCRRVA